MSEKEEEKSQALSFTPAKQQNSSRDPVRKIEMFLQPQATAAAKICSVLKLSAAQDFNKILNSFLLEI